MIRLTDDMRQHVNNSLANRNPCILATASAKGEPSIGYRGSMMAWDDEHLAYWERTKRAGLEHILENPKVVVMYRDPVARVGWKFFGTATAYDQGPLRDAVMSRVVERELQADPERKGLAVLIQVTKITTTGGQVLQTRDET